MLSRWELLSKWVINKNNHTNIPAFISQLTELKNQLQLVEEKSRTETKSLVDQLHHLSGENASTNLENQRLKVLD